MDLGVGAEGLGLSTKVLGLALMDPSLVVRDLILNAKTQELTLGFRVQVLIPSHILENVFQFFQK